MIFSRFPHDLPYGKPAPLHLKQEAVGFKKSAIVSKKKRQASQPAAQFFQPERYLLLLGRSFLFGSRNPGLFGAGLGFRCAGSLRVDEVESILSVERVLSG